MASRPLRDPTTLDAAELDERDIWATAPGRVMRRRALANPGLVFGSVVVGLIVLIAAAAPLLAPHDPYAQDIANRLAPPIWVEGGSSEHLLGTDHLGRDYLSRLLYGARISVMVGLGAAAIGCVIGVALGVVAGFLGGRTDQAVNFLLNCQLALPTLLLAMSLVFLIGPSVTVVIVVIGFLHWNLYLVVVRATTLRIRQLDFVTASRALGAGRLAIIAREVLPNLTSQILVIFTFEMGSAIVAEASLSFLGVGIPSPTPSWGLMIAEGKLAMFFQPWLVILPGLLLFILVLAINLMGDGVRDVAAPEGRS